MKRLVKIMFLAVSGLSTVQYSVAQDVAVRMCEYWTDRQFDSRRTAATTGTWQAYLDMSELGEGLHTLSFRAADREGRWSVPLTRYFLRTGRSLAGNAAAGYEMWIDDDFANRKKGSVVGGAAALDLDLKSLRAGLHRLTLRVNDSQGMWSDPRVSFFVVPDTLPADNAISSYAYWFNRGPRVYVEVEPGNPLVISDLWIDVKDVVPNEIPSDYRFDAEKETVYCDDNVFFGIEAYDMTGRSTQAVLSDEFLMTVPVKPDFIDLDNGKVVTFDAPGAGYVSGFRMHAAAGDSLVWTVSPMCDVDIYASDGSRIKVQAHNEADGKVTFGMRATSDITYVLVHHASEVSGMMDISCTVAMSSAVSGCKTDGCILRTRNGALEVEASESGLLQIVSLTGMSAYSDTVPVGRSDIKLSSGVYAISWKGIPLGKVVVP